MLIRSPPVDFLLCSNASALEHRKCRDVPSQEASQKGNANMGREASGRPQRPYPAEKARGGEIVLKRPLQRWIFVAGLVGAVFLALLLSLLR
jgi:hypothetical protein